MNLAIDQKGAVPILLILGLIGLLVIIGIANLAPFKDSFLKSLYPKDSSRAAEVTKVFNVRDYGAKGDYDYAGNGTDDTAAIQAAIDAADQVTDSAVFLPRGNYRISKLNFVHKDYLTFVGVAQTGTHLISFESDPKNPVLDLTGANSVKLERFDLTMEPNKLAGAGIVMARSKYRGCSHNTLNNVGVYSRSQGGSDDPADIGSWTAAPVFVFGCNYINFFHPIIYNGHTAKGAMILTTINDYGIKSAFTDIGEGTYPASGYRFYQAEIHNFHYNAQGSLILRAVSDVITYGGPFSSFHQPNIYIQDGANKIHIYGTTLYSENDANLCKDLIGNPNYDQLCGERQIQRVPQYSVYVADATPVADLIIDQSRCQNKTSLIGGTSELTLSNIKINCSFNESEGENGYLFNFVPSSNPSRVFLSNAYIMTPYKRIKPPASIASDVTFVLPGQIEMPSGAVDSSKKLQ